MSTHFRFGLVYKKVRQDKLIAVVDDVVVARAATSKAGGILFSLVQGAYLTHHELEVDYDADESDASAEDRHGESNFL